MGSSLRIQEGDICSGPKSHMAGFALTNKKIKIDKNKCYTQLSQLFYNIHGKTDNQIEWVTFTLCGYHKIT